MAAFVFNIAKGRVAHYATLPLANDGLVAILLTAAQADGVLRDHATLGALLATAGNTEASFTGYTRKPLSAVVLSVDNTADTTSVDCADPTAWSPTTQQALVKLVICYDPDVAAGTDADLVPLVCDDFVLTTPTSGTVTYVVNAAGFFGAS